MLNRRNVVYLYDGSFEGLLTVVLRCFEDKTMPFSIESADNVQQEIFCDYLYTDTDFEKAKRVYTGIIKKVSPLSLHNIFYAYLSNMPDKGITIFEYILTGLKYGSKTDNYLSLDCVRLISEAAGYVANESHLYTGFVRFSELEGGIYYSEIEPVNNVLPAIANHFIKRYSAMPFMIHDINRKLCLVYNGKECVIKETSSLPKLNYSKEESEYKKLWKSFYDTVEIKERHNEKCRMTHMPKRYWTHLCELN